MLLSSHLSWCFKKPKGVIQSRVFLTTYPPLRIGLDQLQRDGSSQYISEQKVFKSLLCGRKRTLFMDSCIGHVMSTTSEEAFRSRNTELRFF